MQLDGVRGMLAALNARTRYRFTGVYRLEPPLLRNLCLFDRENPTLQLGGDIDTLAETYCSIVGATGRSVAIDDTHADRRVDDHPARRSVVQSYIGVAILGPDGGVWGTLCHFDQRPRLAPPNEIAVLERAAVQLMPTLVMA